MAYVAMLVSECFCAGVLASCMDSAREVVGERPEEVSPSAESSRRVVGPFACHADDRLRRYTVASLDGYRGSSGRHPCAFGDADAGGYPHRRTNWHPHAYQCHLRASQSDA